MTTPNFPFRYNNNAQRWTNATTGRFISEDTVTNEMYRHQKATYNALDSLTKDLYAGRVDVTGWQAAVALELRDAHLAQAMFGAGGRVNMTQANWGRVGGTLADEYRYLTNFASDISSGRVSEAQALARIKQYGNATQQSYWREYAVNTITLLYWVLRPVNNCSDCVNYALSSPYTIDTIPTYPGAGATRCRGNCACYLTRRDVKDDSLEAQNADIARQGAPEF